MLTTSQPPLLEEPHIQPTDERTPGRERAEQDQ
jgi:hypothetical protein